MFEFRSLATRVAPDADGGMKLCGLAASYSGTADLGAYHERIAPGAFSRSLAKGEDVKALINHDPNRILGRLKNKTLALRDTDQGLLFAVQLNPESQMARDLYTSVQRGDLNECSFAFTVDGPGGDSWDNETDERGVPVLWRTLKSVNLLDVSVVTNPAYTGTDVAARNAKAGHVEFRSKRNFARYAPAGVMADLDATYRRLRDLWAQRIALDQRNYEYWEQMKANLRCQGAKRKG